MLLEFLYLSVIVLLSFMLGIIFTPFIIFLKARKSEAWDNSNMTNIIRVIAHLTVHPNDFGLMMFEDGTRPFWYINKDEFSEVVKTRPKNIK